MGSARVLGDLGVHVVVDLALVDDIACRSSGDMVDVLEHQVDEAAGSRSASSCGKPSMPDDHPDRNVLGVLDGGVELGPAFGPASSSSRHRSRVNGSRAAIGLGANAGSSIRAGHGVERRDRR